MTSRALAIALESSHSDGDGEGEIWGQTPNSKVRIRCLSPDLPTSPFPRICSSEKTFMMRKSMMVVFGMGLIGILGLAPFITAAANDTRVADAAMKGDKDLVRSLIKQAVDVNAAQGDGMTALHWAALNGDAELAQVLLYAGASVRATTRLGGYSPLFMAAKS